jgi:putative flippase GtrA
MVDLIEAPGVSRKDFARHAAGLAKFGAVGVLNVATEFTVFGLMVAAGVTPLAANACGFLCANGQSYLANASFTFRENGKGAPLSFRAYARFFAAHCAALGVSTTSLIALGPAIGLFEAKALAVGVSFLLNYAMSAAFVFGRGASAQRE